jgi:integrase
MARLTVAAVKAAKHDPSKGTRPVQLGDGDGLRLQIASGGGKSWLLRYMLAGRSREMGLGSVDFVTLAEARQRAAEARRQIAQGIDPIDARRKADRAAKAAQANARENDFATVAERYVAAHEPSWRNPKHRAQWRSTLETYAYPVLGDKAVRDIATDDVVRVLRPIWVKKPETASRLRGRIEVILDAATAEGVRAGDNPARWRGHLSTLLPAHGKVATVRHHPALPWEQVKAFMAELRTRVGMSARALEFAILTAARTGEVRGAKWSEVDLDAAVWTVPKERMKASREHRVPLSAPAVAVLRACDPPKHRQDGDRYVFLGERAKKPLSEMAMEMLLRRINEVAEDGVPPWRDRNGDAIVPHGFRSTFRDWCSEATEYPRDLAEAALAHALRDKTEAAYRRGDALEKRRKMMDDWAKFCT